METACVILGKIGDIFSGLPIVQHNRATLVTSRQYAPAVDWIPGINVAVWGGHWQDLAGAYMWAKERFPRVLAAQTYGKDFPVQHSAPSWQHDQWMRAGMIAEFDSLMPHISRAARRDLLEPQILVATGSESSPFEHRDQLVPMLQEAFPDTKVVDLSAMTLPSVRDLLPLYDQASLLVSVDTAHLHVSAASTVPTIAIVADKPQRWHGSAWRSRLAMHCRYGDFVERKGELLRTVKAILSGNPKPKMKAIPRLGNAYNPSIINFDGRGIMSFRYHPEKNWRTALAIDDGKRCEAVKVPKEFAHYSWEDGRLFTLNGALHISYVLSVFPSYPARCAVGYSPLVHNGDTWTIADHRQVQWGRNNFKGMEKNWLFFESNGKLFAIVSSSPQQIVIEIAGDRVIKEHKSPVPPWAYGEIRGGALLPIGDGTAWRFFHSKTGAAHAYYEFRYHIGRLRMRIDKPPFEVLSIDEHPIISGNEMWVDACHHWKPNVVFPGGVVGDARRATLAVGWNDCRCATLDVEL